MLKTFSDTSISSDIEEEITKQISTLKPFDMEPCKAIPKKYFLLVEEIRCKEEINLTPQDRIGNIDWCKYGCECKSIATFAENFCLLLRLKSQSARGASHHSIVRFIYLEDEFFFLFLL